MSKARIAIVDDHPALRRGLSELIDQQPDMEVCGEADGISDGLHLVSSLQPDLVMIDISLKDGHGLDLIKDLKAGKQPPKMLVLSMHEEASYAERALRAGAQGYIPKSEAVDKIVEALRHVLGGEVYLSQRIATRLLRGMVGGGPTLAGAAEDLLSDREMQVFEFLGQGLGSREIGNRLNLSNKTIDTYREHIKHKLGLESGAELVRRAILWVHARGA